ncbi:putative SET domain protein, partial [Trypanosoma rangeli]
KDIKRGELVFEDEGSSFAIVTRPFVERHWGEEEKQTFTEYAWPLDGDGHVYAIWESDPSKWRPINHSCNPNCIFGEDHSLNVIASRDIKKDEELTMDYSTFCDYTMKPFPCSCASECCRGMIVPDEAALYKYGTNVWHRRPPIPPSKTV